MSHKTHLTIDRLVLHGFAPGQRDAVVAAFQTELARLLASEQNGPAAPFGEGRTVPALKVAPRRTGGANPGEAAARQLVQGLRR
jgi:hypothetical protein